LRFASAILIVAMPVIGYHSDVAIMDPDAERPHRIGGVF
jgi:hypothetical protein